MTVSELAHDPKKFPTQVTCCQVAQVFLDQFDFNMLTDVVTVRYNNFDGHAFVKFNVARVGVLSK